ncbi:hypothetical protein [Methylosinus sp. Sm6]|uniref:hypothetical protein n=1 Tax=Methylosinus sp. Sm6 TaxID=2866948 RepID=UPI001C995EF9|nr:hypothetical protein [Methylosinus sp. Sm6]MBY6244059.1 hypothetical protein [Methylosinus sp. Sm6]
MIIGASVTHHLNSHECGEMGNLKSIKGVDDAGSRHADQASSAAHRVVCEVAGPSPKEIS